MRYRVELGDGTSLSYDYLVVATGPELAFDEKMQKKPVEPEALDLAPLHDGVAVGDWVGVREQGTHHQVDARLAGGRVNGRELGAEVVGLVVQALRLMARGISPAVTRALSVEQVDMATPTSQVLIFLNTLPYFVIMAVFMGSSAVIIDATAGERTTCGSTCRTWCPARSCSPGCRPSCHNRSLPVRRRGLWVQRSRVRAPFPGLKSLKAAAGKPRPRA